MIEFNHFNFNVLDLEKSIAFYKEAIGLSVVREKDSSEPPLTYKTYICYVLYYNIEERTGQIYKFTNFFFTKTRKII